MKSLLLFLLATISLTGYAQEKKAVNETVSAAEFQTKLKAIPGAVLLDVRTPEEVANGYIAGAVNIDFNSDDFKKKISSLAKDKTYFVYCAKGGRSSKAVEQMNAMGFQSLYNLEGGFTGWKEKGLPIKK